MRVIIAGSRTIEDYEIVKKAIKDSKFKIIQILSGGARGIDKLGEQYAQERGIAYKIYPALWDKYGKKAGYLRNTHMAEEADALIAIWDGESKGTKHMIDIARNKKLKIYVNST